jgi:glycosyltransferase involved in cell wall biosynthesis
MFEETRYEAQIETLWNDFMTAKPEIAVLLPAYNPGAGLVQTLDSIRKQTVPYQLFLVDDGSKVKLDYKVALKGIPHTLIELPKNVGITLALNAGLAEILKGDFKYVARMDCGDEMTPDRLALQKQYMDAHGEIDILGSWIEMVYTEVDRRFVLDWPIDHDNITRDLWKNMSLSHPAMMVRTSSWRKLGAYSVSYEAAEDYELVRRAMQGGYRFHNLGKVLLIKTENRDSISWRKRRRQLFSRLKAQWRYRKLGNPACVKGLVKTAITLLIPTPMVHWLKAVFAKN